MVGLISKILRAPSQRTQYEASLAGITTILIGSIGTTIYVSFFSDINIWFKILTGLGGLGIFLLMGSNLVLTYLQHYTYKMSMGMYPPDTKLILKISEAETIIKELEDLIKENKENPLVQINDEVENVEHI